MTFPILQWELFRLISLYQVVCKFWYLEIYLHMHTKHLIWCPLFSLKSCVVCFSGMQLCKRFSNIKNLCNINQNQNMKCNIQRKDGMIDSIHFPWKLTMSLIKFVISFISFYWSLLLVFLVSPTTIDVKINCKSRFPTA